MASRALAVCSIGSPPHGDHYEGDQQSTTEISGTFNMQLDQPKGMLLKGLGHIFCIFFNPKSTL